MHVFAFERNEKITDTQCEWKKQLKNNSQTLQQSYPLVFILQVETYNQLDFRY